MRVAVSMWAGGLAHVLLYAVPSVLVWNVRFMDLRYWGMDILVPAFFAGLVIAAYRARVSLPVVQVPVALCVLAMVLSAMSCLRVAVQHGLDAAAGFSLWDATGYLMLAGIPTAVLFILVYAVAQIDRYVLTRCVRRQPSTGDVRFAETSAQP